MREVYRYEKASKYIDVNFGPYTLGSFYINHTREIGRPGILEDSGETFKFGMLCGCPCPESLFIWFKGYNESILNDGFNLVKYIVTDCITTNSGLQTAFDPENIIEKEVIIFGENKKPRN